MLSPEHLDQMQRRFQIVIAIAKHSIQTDAEMANQIGEEQYPLIRAAIDNADYDVAALMTEVRIYGDMFAAKLEEWRHGRGSVGDAQGHESATGGGPLRPEPEGAAPETGAGGDAGQSANRPDASTNTKRAKRRKKAVDTGDG